MTEEYIEKLKKEIICAGELLWNKDLASGINGNISMRVDETTILITATKTCLGLLDKEEILLVDFEGRGAEGGKVSTEIAIHLDIYKNFPEVNAVIHTHTAYANGYFLQNDKLIPKIFETKVYLGDVKALDQSTPAVTEGKPVIDALKKNNIVALKKHGLIAVGKEIFDCFLLVQAVEEAIKVDVVSQMYNLQTPGGKAEEENQSTINDQRSTIKYKLFSQEQIDEIVRLVNADEQLSQLGKKTSMTMELAVKLDEDGTVYSFAFENGKIVNVGNDDKVEFVVSAPENVWRQVFNREVDPFVATTQKKMNLQGDFARISKWYAPCSRLFELWAQVPVE